MDIIVMDIKEKVIIAFYKDYYGWDSDEVRNYLIT